jgi:hypothetical protein
MSGIEDFSPAAIAVCEEMLFERFKRVIGVEVAGAEPN